MYLLNFRYVLLPKAIKQTNLRYNCQIVHIDFMLVATYFKIKKEGHFANYQICMIFKSITKSLYNFILTKCMKDIKLK